jgi:hypothetical protein
VGQQGSASGSQLDLDGLEVVSAELVDGWQLAVQTTARVVGCGSCGVRATPHQKAKRVGHGFRSFANYRLRLLLHCGVRWHTRRTVRLRDRSPRWVA